MSYTDPSERPPTFNVLPSTQRVRRIRSTRKVGVILGTTPRVLDSEVEEDMNEDDSEAKASLPRASADSVAQPFITPVSLRLRRSASISTNGYSPPQPLNLELPSKDANEISRNTSPATTPLTPTFDIAPVERRKKMLDKLSRTLGENIPVELVMSESDESPVSNTTVRLSRSASKGAGKVACFSRSASESKALRHHRHRSSNMPPPLPAEPTSTSNWEGEWNVQDLDTLRSKLRALK